MTKLGIKLPENFLEFLLCTNFSSVERGFTIIYNFIHYYIYKITIIRNSYAYSHVKYRMFSNRKLKM